MIADVTVSPRPTAPIRVLVIDDHPMYRKALVRGLSMDDDIEVVDAGATGQECLALYAQHRPDLVVCDLQLPDMNGIEVIRRLLAIDPGARVVVLTASDQTPDMKAALEAGAAGYLQKHIDVGEFVEMVRDAANGRSVFDKDTAGKLISVMRAPHADGPAKIVLTAREREVLELMADGKSNPEIAAALYLSTNTVKSYVAQIMQKLGVNARAAAVTAAIREGLISVDGRGQPR